MGPREIKGGRKMKKALILLGVFLFLCGVSSAGEKGQNESTIFGNDWQTKEYIRKDRWGNSEIYDQNWERKGFIKDGVIYDSELEPGRVHKGWVNL
jgi:hypothetical protein